MFKSALIYQFTEGHQAPTPEQLEAALSQHECGEPTGSEWERSGFAHIINHFTFGISGATMFRVKTRTRILPDSVIAAEVDRRAESELDESEGRDRVGRRRIKEEATDYLLGRAFIGTSYLNGYVDHERGLIVINTGSASTAEDVLALLRKALETLPVRQFETDLDPSYPLTAWLSNSDQLPDGLSLGENATLKQAGKPGEASLKQTILDGDEVQAHLTAGKKVRKVQLHYKGVRFALNDSLAITGIKPGGEYFGDEYSYGSEYEKYAVDLTLFSCWIRELVYFLSEVMGDS